MNARLNILFGVSLLLGSGSMAAELEVTRGGDRSTIQVFTFNGAKAGTERMVGGVKFCWCPPGTFTMGSPRNEPERRPGEDQVEVTLTRGFWLAKFEATQEDTGNFEAMPGRSRVQGGVAYVYPMRKGGFEAFLPGMRHQQVLEQRRHGVSMAIKYAFRRKAIQSASGPDNRANQCSALK